MIKSHLWARNLTYAEEFGDPFDESEQDQEQEHRRQGSMGA